MSCTRVILPSGVFFFFNTYNHILKIVITLLWWIKYGSNSSPFLVLRGKAYILSPWTWVAPWLILISTLWLKWYCITSKVWPQEVCGFCSGMLGMLPLESQLSYKDSECHETTMLWGSLSHPAREREATVPGMWVKPSWTFWSSTATS